MSNAMTSGKGFFPVNSAPYSPLECLSNVTEPTAVITSSLHGTRGRLQRAAPFAAALRREVVQAMQTLSDEMRSSGRDALSIKGFELEAERIARRRMEEHGRGGVVGVRPHFSREWQSRHRSRTWHRLLGSGRLREREADRRHAASARARHAVPGPGLPGSQRLPRSPRRLVPLAVDSDARAVRADLPADHPRRSAARLGEGGWAAAARSGGL